MNNPEQVIQLAEQYRQQLQAADTKDAIRERQQWFREQGANLFKPGTPDTTPNK